MHKFTLKLTFLLFSAAQSYAQINNDWFQAGVGEVLTLPREQPWADIKITTASRTEESVDKALATTRVITAEQIKLRGYQKLIEVLEDLPEFKINHQTEDTYFHTTSFRGVLGNEKFIVLLDGVRISSPTNDRVPFLYNYPVFLAEQVEVVYGPASALYGADALSGVINIITKKPNAKKTLQLNTTLGTSAMVNVEGFYNQRIDNKTSLTVAANFGYDPHPNYPRLYEDDSLMNLSGLENSSFNTIFGAITPQETYTPDFNFNVKGYALYWALQAENFRLTLFKNYSETPSSVGLSPQNSIYGSEVTYGHHILMGSMSYTKNIRNVSLLTSIMGSTYEVDKNSNFRNVFSNLEPAYKYAFGSEFKISQDIYWQVSRNVNLMGGVTFERFFSIPKSADLDSPVDKSVNISASIVNTPLEAKFFNLEYFNFGSFVQSQITPSEKVQLTLGSRFDYNSRFGPTVNPRLGAVVQPTDKTIFKAFFGSAFLAPSPEVTFEHYGSFIPDSNNGYFSFFWHLPNPDLLPIKSRNVEIGFVHKFSKKLTLNFNSFYTRLVNLYNVQLDSANNLYDGQFLGWPVADIEIPINEGTQNNYGGTIQLDFRNQTQNSSLYAYLALSYIDGKVDELEDGNFREIGMISPIIFKGGVDLSWNTFSIAPRFIFVNKQRLQFFEADNIHRQTLDGNVLVNLFARKEFSDKTAVFLKVHNLLNQRYRGSNSLANKNDRLVFFGAPQQPIRLFAGIQIDI